MNDKPTNISPDLFDPWIHKCCSVLQQEGTILYPTDTIWGIGCDATNEQAIKKVFTIKNRPENKPFVLLAADVDMIDQYVKEVPPKIDQILFYHKRPLSVVYKDAHSLPSLAIHETGTVAFRIPQDDFCLALLKKYGKPLVATSANKAGVAFPKNFGEISSEMLSQVDYILPYRQAEKSNGEPSMLVTLSEKNELIFLRK